MNLEQASPAPALRDCVRCFQQRRAHIRGAAAVYPIAARPDQFLEFYLQDPYIVRIGDAAAPEIVPHSVVVGPCTQAVGFSPVKSSKSLTTACRIAPVGRDSLRPAPRRDAGVVGLMSH